MSSNPTKSQLINDLQRIKEEFGESSRDAYLQHGLYTKSAFVNVFGSFGDFYAEAFGTASPNEVPEKQELTGDKWDISLPKTRIHTLPELLEYCKVDLAVWTVEKFRSEERRGGK